MIFSLSVEQLLGFDAGIIWKITFHHMSFLLLFSTHFCIYQCHFSSYFPLYNQSMSVCVCVCEVNLLVFMAWCETVWSRAIFHHIPYRLKWHYVHVDSEQMKWACRRRSLLSATVSPAHFSNMHFAQIMPILTLERSKIPTHFISMHCEPRGTLFIPSKISEGPYPLYCTKKNHHSYQGRSSEQLHPFYLHTACTKNPCSYLGRAQKSPTHFITIHFKPRETSIMLGEGLWIGPPTSLIYYLHKKSPFFPRKSLEEPRPFH